MKRVLDPNTSPSSSSELNKSSNGVIQRPISDFVNTQTTYIVWTDVNAPNPKIFFSDFAGVANNAFGLNISSTYDGSITDRPLSDGTAEVTIKLKALNVLTFVEDQNHVTLFGEKPSVLAITHGTPTLGDANLDVTFINSAPGAPIPDLFDISSSASKLYLNAEAFGPLKAAAGFGPDGIPGHAWTNQVGSLTRVGSNGHPGEDGYAVEYIKLQPVGNTH